MGQRSALDLAIELFRRPMAVRDYQKAPLPTDVLTVIRIAAGADVEVGRFGLDHEKRVREIQEACAFYVQQVMFHPNADEYRMLGLMPGATARQVQDHKRMLLKWLHPDRNPNKWEQVLFQRVIKAAAHLEGVPAEEASLAMPVFSPNPPSKQRRSRASRRYAAQRVRVPINWRRRIMRHALPILVVVGGVATAWGLGHETSFLSTYDDKQNIGSIFSGWLK